MKPNLRYLFPRGSKAFFKANETETDHQLQTAKPERASAETLDLVCKRQKKGDGRFTLRIISRRVRPIDPDNLAAGCKALVDCLRGGKLIPGDDPTQIKLEIEQERVPSFAQEQTEIEITWPE